MLSHFKDLFKPKVVTFNERYSFRVSGVSVRHLCACLTEYPGVAFTKKPSLIQSCVEPLAVFTFRDVTFQIDHGGDTGGDGLWIMPKDGLPHPDELLVLREHLTKSFSQK